MDTNARIAAVAAEQFHEHGITSTGVDALSRAAGISKRTLYERFGSKDGLIVAAYETLDLPVFRMFAEAAEAASDTPSGQIDAFFAQLEAMVRTPEFRGCPSRTRRPSWPTTTTRRTPWFAATRSGSGAGCGYACTMPARATPRCCPAS